MATYTPLIDGDRMGIPGHLAGSRFDVCIVFPYKVSNDVMYNDEDSHLLRLPTEGERRQMDKWTQKREVILKQMSVVGLEFKLFLSRDRDEVFCKIGTDVKKLEEIAEVTRHKLKMRDEKGGGYGPFKRDYPGSAALNYTDRRIVSPVYQPVDSSVYGKEALFGSYDRITLIDKLIRSTERGCAGIDIGSFIKSKDILAYFPLHEQSKIEELDRNWLKCFVLGTSLDSVRDYLGDRYAMYFAWMSHFMKALVVLVFFCLGATIIHIFTRTADNALLPFFCFGVAVWSTLFPHTWARKANTLAVRWGTYDTDSEEELIRPEFRGERRISPITQRPELFYPWSARVLQILVSAIVLMLCMAGGLVVTSFVFVMRHILGDAIPGGHFLFMLALATTVHILNSVFNSIAKKLTDKENYSTNSEYETALLSKTLLFKLFNTFGPLYYIAFIKERWNLIGFQMTCYKDDCLYDVASQLTVFVLYFLVIANALEFLSPKLRAWSRSRLDHIAIDTGAEHAQHRTGAVESGQAAYHQPNNRMDMPLMPDSDPSGSYSGGGGGYRGQPNRMNLDSAHQIVSGAAVSIGAMSLAERQSKMDVQDSPFAEFDEMVLQFGYTTLFVVAAPWVTLLAFIAVLVECYIDKTKFLTDTRRPFPFRSGNIGVWSYCFEILAFLAVVTNGALVVLGSRKSETNPFNGLSTFVIFEHFVLFLRLLAVIFFPVLSSVAKQLFLKNKHHIGIHIENAGQNLSSGSKGLLVDNDGGDMSMKYDAMVVGGRGGRDEWIIHPSDDDDIDEN